MNNEHICSLNEHICLLIEKTYMNPWLDVPKENNIFNRHASF